MIVVCNQCGTHSRVRDLALAHRVRCATCKTMLGPEVQRQADRNAAIVLELAAFLLYKIKRLNTGDELVAEVLTRHQRESLSPERT